MSEPQLKKRIEVPTQLTPEQRTALAEKVIAAIQARTDKGLDVKGRPFAKYSTSYVSSSDFKTAGKSASEVNLQLTKDMINSVQLLKHGKGYLEIGFEADTDANDKGVWNQRSDNGPSRTFLGIEDKQLERLVSEVKLETPGAEAVSGQLADSLAAKILKRLGL